MPRPSAHGRLVVVQHQDGVKTKRRVILFLVALVAAAIAYLSGYYQISHMHETAVDKLTTVSQDYAALVKVESELRQKVANLESGREIDLLAKQEILDTIQHQKAEISSLKKDVSFYKRIMNPSEDSRGLQLKAELKATNVDRAYDYYIVLAKLGDLQNRIAGVMSVHVVGQHGGKQVAVPLKDLSENVSELDIKFRIQFYRELKGSLVLPEGFNATSLKVVAEAKGRKTARVEQSFDWKALLANNS